MSKPKIRFKGYEEDWEQRKLPEFVTFFNGLTYTPDDVEETGTLVLRSSNVKNGEIVDADNVYVNDKVVTSENVQEGDIIVVVRNGSRALIGKHAQIKAPMPNTVIGAFMSGIRSEHSSFVNALLDTSAFENEIAKNMGATINQITGYMFSKMEFMIPSGEEQQKIGEYFQSFDDLITLHQRKCEETKKLKKYMLQKMFPQNGKRVPEIRFAGFTDDWEQRKLSDVVDSVDTGKSKFDKEGSSGEYPILGSTSVIGYDDEYDYEGDFILTARVGANAGSLYRHAGKVKISDNTVFIQASQNIEFLYQLLIRFDIKRLSFGTGQPLVKASELKRLELMMPTDMEEQMRIGVYFKNLDHLITLHQRKYEELQKIKKFMLQNMFI